MPSFDLPFFNVHCKASVSVNPLRNSLRSIPNRAIVYLSVKTSPHALNLSKKSTLRILIPARSSKGARAHSSARKRRIIAQVSATLPAIPTTAAPFLFIHHTLLDTNMQLYFLHLEFMKNTGGFNSQKHPLCVDLSHNSLDIVAQKHHRCCLKTHIITTVSLEMCVLDHIYALYCTLYFTVVDTCTTVW